MDPRDRNFPAIHAGRSENWKAPPRRSPDDWSAFNAGCVIGFLVLLVVAVIMGFVDDEARVEMRQQYMENQ